MDRISVLEYANSLIHAFLVKEQKILIKLLRERVDSSIKVRAGCGGNSHSNMYIENDLLSINDYRNYLWICVKNGEQRHWLTLFFNDVDEKSGNFHTQFGRIQFWRNVDSVTKGRYGVNRKCEENSACWVLDKGNMKDPHRWVDAPNYRPTEIVNDFLRFVRIENKFNEKGENGNGESTEQENGSTDCCIDFSNCINCCANLRKQIK